MGPSAPRGGASAVTVGWRERLDAARDHHRASARDALRRMRAAWFSTSLTVLVIGLALALPAALQVLVGNASALAGHFAAQAQVTVFLDRAVDDTAQAQLAAQLRRRADVAEVAVITRAQALDELRAMVGDGAVLEALEGDNPLPGLLLVLPREATAGGAALLRDQLQKLPGVERVRLDSDWLEKLAAMLDLAARLALALAVGFGLVVLLVIVNTIRLAIAARTEEVLVVKLVGATDAFVRRPFLYTGLWHGLAGGLIAAVLVAGLVAWLEGPVARLAALYGSGFSLSGPGPLLVLALAGVGAGLGLLAAWLAAWRHLRGVEPHGD
jgi:cell division transport system permease protein